MKISPKTTDFDIVTGLARNQHKKEGSSVHTSRQGALNALLSKLRAYN